MTDHLYDFYYSGIAASRFCGMPGFSGIHRRLYVLLNGKQHEFTERIAHGDAPGSQFPDLTFIGTAGESDIVYR
jgi:hypothetical protein